MSYILSIYPMVTWTTFTSTWSHDFCTQTTAWNEYANLCNSL